MSWQTHSVECSLSVRSPGEAINVLFFRCNEQFHHLFQCQLDDGGAVNLLQCCRTDELEVCENGSSPPIQQVIKENHDGKEVVMAVGLSGRSHWSTAFSIDSERQAIVVEHACRMNEPMNWIGSTYLIGDDAKLFESDGLTRLTLSINNRQFLLEAQEGTKLEFEEASRRATLTSASGPTSNPATVVWGYTVSAVE